MHASASPFEALAERSNWLRASISKDAFGKALLASGIPLPLLTKEWLLGTIEYVLKEFLKVCSQHPTVQLCTASAEC